MMKNKNIHSKIRHYSILCPFLLFTAFSFLFSACQEESEEITPPPTDKVILPNSVIATLIQHIALNDGSSDNILDNSSCTSLVLPVTVVVNGHEIHISSEDDFKLVERILDEVENDDDTLTIIFPVTVILSDYSRLIVTNEEQLEDITEQCIEGGVDDDIECIDFKYPLIFSVYDSNNQVSSLVTVNNDQELFEFFDGLSNDHLISFKFPVTVVLSSGEEVTLNDNNELKDSIENTSGDCDEDDDNDHNDDDADNTALIAVLIAGEWEITYFFNETDKTDAFENFVFSFHKDGTALAANGVSSINGTWKSYGDDGFLELEFDFGEETPFDDIQEDWELVEFSNSFIKLKDVNGGDGSVNTLVFEKM